ncbi:MAG: DUF6777 domain-containing protein [Actinomycetota bacterium]
MTQQGQPGQWFDETGQTPVHTYQPPPAKKRRTGLIITVVAVVAGLLTAGGLFFVNRSTDSNDVAEDATYVITQAEATAAEPVFEPRGDRGDDPFFPLEAQFVAFMDERSGDDDGTGGDGAGEDGAGGDGAGGDDGGGGDGDGDGDSGLDGAADTASAEDFTLEALQEESKTGLYGGTAENTCDPERLIAFLVDNPDLGMAWAQVQGITFPELPAYIRSLEVRVLAEPVAVLNHGYSTNSKTAYEIHTVLDAGTAVLVDGENNIRTRCFCGNPIKPKPPEEPTPPACLLAPIYVRIVPETKERRGNVPSNVWLTGRVAMPETAGEPVLREIRWGDGSDQMGWAPVQYLVENHYCRPPAETPICLVGESFVYPSPTAADTDHIGVLSGDVGAALIRPVGGGDRVIANGRVLISFFNPTIRRQSAWMSVDDIVEAPREQCVQEPICVVTPVPRTIGGGAPVPGESAGPRWVTYTGHFHNGADQLLRFAEVRLDYSGNRLAYLDLQEDVDTVRLINDLTACENPPPPPPNIHCKSHGDGTFGEDDFLYASSTATIDIAGALTDPIANPIWPDVVAFAGSVPVEVIGSTTPTNGRVEVRLMGTGPVGWLDASLLDGNACVPHEFCASIDAPIFREFRDSGPTLTGTPTGGPTIVRAWPAIALTGEASTVANDVDLLYAPVEVGGQLGWADSDNGAFIYGDCAPPPPATCPPEARYSGANVVEPFSCCVYTEQGPQLAAYTGRTRPSADFPGLTEVEVTNQAGQTDWGVQFVVEFNAIQALNNRACDPPVTSSTPIGCPDLPNGTSAVPNSSACCSVSREDGQVNFVEVPPVEVTAAEDGALAAADDTETDFVPGEFCVQPECAADETQLDDGSCEPIEQECPIGKTLIDGECECPAGERELPNGECAPDLPTNPCRTDQEQLADGSCRDRAPTTPTCRSDQQLVNGRCVCATGQVETNGSCQAPPPDCSGDQVLIDGECRCPTGTAPATSGSTVCEIQCEFENYVVNNDGVCRCPEGQLTVLPNKCCPSDLEPDGLGRCVERCPGVFIDGRCQVTCPPGQVFGSSGQCEDACPDGQVRDNQGLCVNPCPPGEVLNQNFQCVPECPPGQVLGPLGDCELPGTGGCQSGIIAPADGECCVAGLAVDAGGYCAPACTGVPGNPIRDFDGICCPRDAAFASSVGALFNSQTGFCEPIT